MGGDIQGAAGPAQRCGGTHQAGALEARIGARQEVGPLLIKLPLVLTAWGGLPGRQAGQTRAGWTSPEGRHGPQISAGRPGAEAGQEVTWPADGAAVPGRGVALQAVELGARGPLAPHGPCLWGRQSPLALSAAGYCESPCWPAGSGPPCLGGRSSPVWSPDWAWLCQAWGTLGSRDVGGGWGETLIPLPGRYR